MPVPHAPATLRWGDRGPARGRDVPGITQVWQFSCEVRNPAEVLLPVSHQDPPSQLLWFSSWTGAMEPELREEKQGH